MNLGGRRQRLPIRLPLLREADVTADKSSLAASRNPIWYRG
jgi:hypothetical protein